MKIRFKYIEHERTQDAPFIGALICAIDCNLNCEGCFNQHMKEMPTQELDSKEIIGMVKSYKFNDGIILSGLEWTLQPLEMKELIIQAKNNNLKVILYTGLTKEDFISNFSDIYDNIKGIYIKFGEYDNSKLSDNNYYYNIKLSSTNQNIEEK